MEEFEEACPREARQLTPGPKILDSWASVLDPRAFSLAGTNEALAG